MWKICYTIYAKTLYAKLLQNNLYISFLLENNNKKHQQQKEKEERLQSTQVCNHGTLWNLISHVSVY